MQESVYVNPLGKTEDYRVSAFKQMSTINTTVQDNLHYEVLWILPWLHLHTTFYAWFTFYCKRNEQYVHCLNKMIATKSGRKLIPPCEFLSEELEKLSLDHCSYVIEKTVGFLILLWCSRSLNTVIKGVQ